MKLLAAEHWPLGKYVDVMSSLEAAWGIESLGTWHREHDYDLINLALADHVYTWFMLKWPELISS